MIHIQHFMETLDIRKEKLNKAILNERSLKWRLYLWSIYIRTRDDHRCVNCYSNKNIQAHHIMRKTVSPIGALELGNGITLCIKCHKKVHAEFNGRPLPNEPLNARGGDDQDEMAYLYGILYEDAQIRGIPQDEYYFISDDFIKYINKYQGYDMLVKNINNSGISRLRLVHEIWRIMPLNWYTKLGEQTLYEIAYFEHKRSTI